jgi:diguanylate cyclase (GGDEF)-like protein
MNKKRLLAISLSIVMAIFVSALIGFCLSYHPTYPVLELEDGWTVSINSSVHEDVNLFEFYKIMDSNLKRGDDITMTLPLPDDGDIPFPVILFRSRYTTLRCYIDDECLYDFGQDLYQNQKFIGKMYHFITLPLNYQGREFKMIMKVGENDAFSSLAAPTMGSQPDVESKFINDNRMIITTGMFLMIFGAAFFCITMFFVSSVPDIKAFLIGSVFCMNLSAWILSYYSVLSPFIYTPYETQIEYFTLYLIVPYCYLMMYFIQKIENRKLYLAFAALTAGVSLTQYVLHYLFNIHLRVTLPMYHIIAVMGFVLIMYYLIRNLKKRDISTSGMIQMVGIVAFAIAEISHLVFYMLGTIHIRYSEFIGIVLIDTGCLLFVMCQLANYLLFITNAYAQRQEVASLSHLAYADGLTNLPNRAKSDKVLEDLNSTDLDYCIISVDLNGLKTVNDKFGHPSGDKYIKDFSKVLTTTFEEAGFCARIGGDEFVVILKNSTEKDVNALLNKMTSALNVMNALYTEYHRSVATGHAFRHECPEGSSSHEVYLLADQRMYERKKEMHEKLGISVRL